MKTFSLTCAKYRHFTTSRVDYTVDQKVNKEDGVEIRDLGWTRL